MSDETTNVGLSKLFIVSLEEGESKTQVEAQFNPRELALDRAAAWAKHAGDGQANSQNLEFTGQDGRSLTLELLFDCSEQSALSLANFQAQLKNLEALATVRDPKSTKPEMRRPHQCAVVWGGFWTKAGLGQVDTSFKCVIESLAIKYTMFASSGVPIRATANVKFKEAERVATAKDAKPASPSQSGGATNPSGT